MVQQKFDCAAHELRPLGKPDHARSPVPILSRLISSLQIQLQDLKWMKHKLVNNNLVYSLFIDSVLLTLVILLSGQLLIPTHRVCITQHKGRLS